MAVADGTEIPGTFGISADRIRLCMAGGIPKDSNMPGGTEDDTSAGELVGSKVARTDLVIAISASGSTPYTVGLVRAAKDAGAKVVAIANNPDADLFNFADVSVLLETPPEIISGSTRLGAATAQKVALNLMSSLMGLRIGNVYDGMMVAQVDTARAEDSLASAGGAVKNAVLIALGASPTNANKFLQEEQGLLRNAIARVSCDNNKCS
jgi:N-acetylmuramic acid 6-phosphate etherase